MRDFELENKKCITYDTLEFNKEVRLKKFLVHIIDFSSLLTENLIKTEIKGGFDLPILVITNLPPV